MKALKYQIVEMAIVTVISLVMLAHIGCSKKVQKKPQILPIAEEVGIVMPQKIEKEEPVKAEVDFSVAAISEVVVYFDFDSWKLLPQEAMKLDVLFDIPCDIVGHACTWGSEGYNMGLSVMRGNMVADYLGGGHVIGVGESYCEADCEKIYEQECKDCRKVVIRPRR